MKLRMLLSVVLLAGVVCASPIASLSAPTAPEATPAATPPPKRFNFADVRRRAEMLANQPFQTPSDTLPDFLKNLDYDQYRYIRFRAEKSLWRDAGLPFEIQFAPLGFLFNRKVAISIVDEGEVSPVEYSSDLFDYDHSNILICLQ